MYILAIETTGKYASVSLYDLDKNEVILEKRSDEERSHLKGLVPMIDDLLKCANVKKSEIKYIAPSVGPGSFTGIRIGVATARALSQGLGIKLISCSTLAAFLCKEEAKEALNKGKTVVVILNARRMQVYGLVYREGEYVLMPGPYMLDDILEATKDDKNVYFFGDGIDAYSKYLEDDRFEFALDRYQDSKSVNILASENVKSAKMYNEVVPEYMRMAEAEVKLKKGELKISHMKQE